ncbi:pectate lyase superfamily protein-domain-containing protein [Aspergillus fruticulosus]
MSDAGCMGPDCTFTGEASGARKGWCTDEAGYISNGEIQEILDNNTNARTFLDNSFSSILVYNETKWVAYSNDANRKQRETLFQGLNMGVVDRVSVPITKWAQFYELIDEGNDPYSWGTRTGDWTDLNCDDDADAIRTYKNDYKPNGRRFTESVFDFFNAEEQECGLLTEEADGDDALSCPDTQGSGSGPAGWEVLNSLVKINADAGSDINEPEKAQEFVDTFAPVKDHTTAFNVLMDILGIVVPSAMAPAINSVLRNTAYFTRNPNKLDTAKDITYTLVAGWVNLAKDTNPEDYDWDDDDAAAFKLQMSKTFDLWELSAGSAAEELFNGSDKSIATLTKAIKDGQLIDGLIGEGTTQLPRYSRREMEDLIKASFFSYAIPQVWQESSRSVFWLDTDGHPCDDDSNPVSDYIFDATAEATKACYQGKTYYLVYPEGTASNTCQTPGGGQGTCRPYRFDAPPGVEMTQNYGVLLDDMLASSIHSYNENNGKNGWDLKDLSRLDDNTIKTAALRMRSRQLATTEFQSAVARRHLTIGVITTMGIVLAARVCPTTYGLPNYVWSLQLQMFYAQTGTTQQGIYMENGSGGFLSDLTFVGGNFGAFFGNQQFTTSHLVFVNCNTALQVHWDWAWTMQDIVIESCETLRNWNYNRWWSRRCHERWSARGIANNHRCPHRQ